MPELTPLAIVFLSMFSSFLIAMVLAPYYIHFLRKNGLGKNIRKEASGGGVAKLFRKLHLKKEGTPTMGGILIWGTTLFLVLVSRGLSLFGIIPESLLDRGEVYLPLFTLVTMGFLGAVDDYLNILESKHKGLHIHPKLFFILLFSLIGALWFYFKLDYTSITVPFYGVFEMGFWYIPFFVLTVGFMSNAVNFTDGLDGLAGGLLVMSYGAFAVLAFFSDLFTLSAFCTVIIGAMLAFLWHNVPPAKFYMGDTGSLALGATLGVIAMMTDSVFVLPIIGFVFIVEILSVIIQLTSKKLRNGKKVFHIAPIHHHFEYIGWTESQIVMRAWIVGGFCTGIGIIIGIIS
jgi:phospho-N-acetylmuramoyl-pentapeptide-transferase